MKSLIVFTAFLLNLLPLSVFADEADSRTALAVSADEKTEILAGMRNNLLSVQQILAALAEEDFATVEQIAGELGKMDHSEEILQRRKKMPESYRSIGPSLHQGFQALSRDARDFGDVQHSLAQLSEVMGICTGCHHNYRLHVAD